MPAGAHSLGGKEHLVNRGVQPWKRGVSAMLPETPTEWGLEGGTAGRERASLPSQSQLAVPHWGFLNCVFLESPYKMETMFSTAIHFIKE